MEPVWRPLSALPELTSDLDAQLADVEHMTEMLAQARERPHVLDAETLDRVIRVYGEAAELAEVYAKQARRWRMDKPDVDKTRQIDRLERQNERYGDGARSLVDLARELKVVCIDAIMAMSDEDLGRAVMTGQLKPPMAEARPDAQRTNVTQLPVPLTINERFLSAFLDESPPCAALGLVEQAREVKAFVAVQLEQSLPMQNARSGFDFGVEVLGNDRYQVLHFILDFPGLEPLDILLNPSNLVVGKMVDVMRRTGEYFFFVVESNSMMAFHNHMGRKSGEWFDLYGDIVHTATTTPDDYERGAKRLVDCGDMLRGRLLNWVCRDDPSSLDLAEDRLEVRCGGS